MKYIDYAEKLETIKYLAEHKRAGTPEMLAGKLQVSERTLQRMVQQLRDHGYPIFFNRWNATYEVKDK
jgi:predicted DNA-binding transcriptional regulator YafY